VSISEQDTVPLASDTWGEASLDTPSPPGPRGEPFGVATDVTWFVNIDAGTNERSMSHDEIKASILSGDLSAVDLVWRVGMPEWLALSDVPEFEGAIRRQRRSRP
jgi:hypothetical protein